MTDLDKIRARIRRLRNMTTAKGCTEAEAKCADPEKSVMEVAREYSVALATIHRVKARYHEAIEKEKLDKLLDKAA